MMIYEICFSPTGGTKRVADILTGGLKGDVVSVDLTDHRTEFQNVMLDTDDVAIVAVPSYGGRVPVTAIERLSKIRGNCSRAVLVCVYGNRAYEDTLIELQDAVSEAGFHIIAGVCAVAEHSIARHIAEGRPNREDLEQLIGFSGELRRKVFEGDTTEPMIPGNRPNKKRGKSGMVPMPIKDCMQCGVCAEKCPVQAIDTENPEKVDRNVCISCMRRVSVCPHSARKLDAVMLTGVCTMLEKVCSEHRTNELFL